MKGTWQIFSLMQNAKHAKRQKTLMYYKELSKQNKTRWGCLWVVLWNFYQSVPQWLISLLRFLRVFYTYMFMYVCYFIYLLFYKHSTSSYHGIFTFMSVASMKNCLKWYRAHLIHTCMKTHQLAVTHELSWIRFSTPNE